MVDSFSVKDGSARFQPGSHVYTRLMVLMLDRFSCDTSGMNVQRQMWMDFGSKPNDKGAPSNVDEAICKINQ